MNAQKRIEAAFAAKNWRVASYAHEPIDYAPEGREGGYEVDIDLDYFDAEGLDDATRWEREERYMKAFEAANKLMQARATASQGKHNGSCDAGCILAYYMNDVLMVAADMPDRLSLHA